MFETILRIFFDLHTIAVIGVIIVAVFVRTVVKLHMQERTNRKARGGLTVTSGTRATHIRSLEEPPGDVEPESYSWNDIVSRCRDDGPDTEEFEMTWDDHGQARRKNPEPAGRPERGYEPDQARRADAERPGSAVQLDDELPTDRAIRPVGSPLSGGGSGTQSADQP